MKYAIIAAGEGSRLAAEGVSQPKPLVKIGNETMIDRLIRIFMQNDADEIVVICNAAMPEVASHLQTLQRDGLQGHPVPLRFVVKNTLSSMHSFYELSPYLDGSSPNFILTTVDTIFREEEFADYVHTFQRLTPEGACDGLMGVTTYIDDEKPLYVECGMWNEECEMFSISGFYDSLKNEKCSYFQKHLEYSTCHMPHATYISAGIYGLTPSSLVTLRACVERGEQRMRNFQRALLRDGLRLQAYPFTKVFDIDHATDIENANKFVIDN